MKPHATIFKDRPLTEQEKIAKQLSNELEFRNCPLCGSDIYAVLIPGDHYRNRDEREVVQCSQCGFVYTREVLKRLERIYTERQDEGFDQENGGPRIKEKNGFPIDLKRSRSMLVGRREYWMQGAALEILLNMQPHWDGMGTELTLLGCL